MASVETDGSAKEFFDIEWVPIAPQVVVPRHFTGSGEVDGYQVSMKLEADPETGSVDCVSVTVEGGAAAVTGAALRGVPVTFLVKESVRQVAASQLRDDDGVSYMVLGGDRAARIPDEVMAEWPHGDTDVVLHWVADCYRHAAAIGDPPAVAVVEATGWSRPTANRALRLARDKGFLGADEGRGAFGGTRTRLRTEGD